MFVKVAGKFITYCRRGSSFEGFRLERLKAKRLKKMFIKRTDEIPYRQYLEESIDAAYKSDKAIEIRAEVIQGFQQSAAELYMEDLNDQMAYEHARSSAQRFVEFLEREPLGAQAILKMTNSDKSITHHGVNVATLSSAMAIAANLRDTQTIHLLALGCFIHDIEHFHTDFDISRPISSLSPQELQVYKSHPMEGARRFQTATFVDQLVHRIILEHEENIDGSGFPKGLREEDMDPLIMIAATANAYDRLVAFEKMDPKDALKTLLIDKMGVYPLKFLQIIQDVLKAQNLV